MSEKLEECLRRALRPVDPGERFTQRVMLRVMSEPPRSPRAQILRRRWLPVALTASIAMAMMIVYEQRAQRERAGLEARRQLLEEALQITGEKLDLTSAVINRQSTSQVGGNPGA